MVITIVMSRQFAMDVCISLPVNYDQLSDALACCHLAAAAGAASGREAAVEAAAVLWIRSTGSRAGNYR